MSKPLTPAGMQPTFSVIILLPGDRGVLDGCLAGWREQRYPRRRYEVLGVCDDAQPRAPREGLDHILRELGAHRCKLYDLGARAARGQFVLLTESHCLPEPDLLAELDGYLQKTSYDGACCQSEPICHDNLARVDHRLFDEGFRVFRQEGDWRKINVHGVAIRREAYLHAGGLDHRYRLFAEMVLAARLRDLGYRLGFAERAVVRHNYRAALREVIDFLADGVIGECVYRRDHPGPDAVGYTFAPPPQPEDGNGELLRILRRTLGADVLRRAVWQRDGATLGAFGRALLWSLRAGRRARWLAYLSVVQQALGCLLWRWHLPRLERHYRRLCEAACRHAYWSWTARHPAPRSAALPRPYWPIADVPEEDLVGFHGKERWLGDIFRWTGAASLVRLPLAPEDREIVLETRNLRQDLPTSQIAAYWGGRRLAASSVVVEREAVRLVLPAVWPGQGSPACLAITCRPMQPWKQGVPDRRELGVPIFAIECRRAAGAHPSGSPLAA